MAYRVDKVTSERNTKTLRELVKRPENKVCADCKRHDPRWASWNLGVFVCIRCSGIHRSMGTHISKVKSVDLDMWTPEQMASIQKWGNQRANTYWEAHLKPGHIPPDHKIESFIRSKYESRRWAMEGPPPTDPSVLDGQATQHEAELPSVPPASPPAPTASRTVQAQPVPASPMRQQPVQQHTMLSATHIASPPVHATRPVVAAPKPAQSQAPAPAPKQDDSLWSLDFNPSSSSTTASVSAPQKDVKSDIMSLFAKAPAAPSGILAGNVPQAAPVAVPQSFMGNSGTSMWGASSGWQPPAPAAPVASNVWGAPPAAVPSAPSAFGTDIWGTPAPVQTNSLFDTPGLSQPKKDDAFGDLWSTFK